MFREIKRAIAVFMIVAEIISYTPVNAYANMSDDIMLLNEEDMSDDSDTFLQCDTDVDPSTVSDEIVIDGKIYYTGYSTSNYSTDTTVFSCSGSTLNIDINWMDAPLYEDRYGSRGYVVFTLFPELGTDGEQVDIVYYDENGCDFSTNIDLSSKEDGLYTLMMYPNYTCAVDEVFICKKDGKVYVGEGFAGTSKTALERYNILLEDLYSRSPQELLDQYKQSADYIYTYSSIDNVPISQIAHDITIGKERDYDKARAIYEYIGSHISIHNETYCRSIMMSMLASINIPAVRIDSGPGGGWIYFYWDEKWYLCSPYRATFKNNVGCFDSNKQMFLVEFLNYVPYIHEYTSASGKTKDTFPIKYKGKYLRDEEVSVFNLVNEYRTANGGNKLNLDKQLTKAAELRAREISVYYEHLRPNGQNIYSAAGTGVINAENIASGQEDAATVMQDWENSSGHRANILNSSYTGIGVACYEHDGKKYWVQLFGEKASEENDILENEESEYTVYSLPEFMTPVCTQTSLKMEVGEKAYNPIKLRNLGLTGFYSAPERDCFQYRSGNESVATVSESGEVCAVGNGKTEIVASIADKEISYEIVVQTNEEKPKEGYHIEYILDGGTNDDRNPDSYETQNQAIKLYNATKPGYKFTGWYYYKGAKLAKMSQIPKNSKQDYTLYAKWSAPIKYKIAYYLNKGNLKNQPYLKNYTVETGNYTLPIPKREGYQFGGWYTTKTFDGTPVTQIITAEAKNIALYAKWTYQIQFNANAPDAEGTMTAETLTSGKKTTLSNNQFVRVGYTFKQWTTNPDGKGKTIKNKAIISDNPITKNGDSIILYANWEAYVYSIMYNPNGGAGKSVEHKKLKYGKTYGLKKNKFKREGYRFVGWNTMPDGSGDFYADEASVSNLTAENKACIVLYAQWEPNL